MLKICSECTTAYAAPLIVCPNCGSENSLFDYEAQKLVDAKAAEDPNQVQLDMPDPLPQQAKQKPQAK